jgi:hypothetical protein
MNLLLLHRQQQNFYFLHLIHNTLILLTKREKFLLHLVQNFPFRRFNNSLLPSLHQLHQQFVYLLFRFSYPFLVLLSKLLHIHLLYHQQQ